MKKVLSLILMMMVMLVSSVAFAYDVTETNIKKLVNNLNGTWVDAQGHRPITFANYALNNIRIMDVKNVKGNEVKGSADLILGELTGTQELRVSWANENGSKVLRIDDLDRDTDVLVMYRKTGDIKHAESIGGITLDMTEDQLNSVYGRGLALPVKDTTGFDAQTLEILEYLNNEAKNTGIEEYAWYYPKSGVVVTFDRRTYTVDRVVLLFNSDKALDRSVLTCNSPLDKFAGLYGWQNEPKAGDVVDMGNGEYMDFSEYPYCIILSLKNK